MRSLLIVGAGGHGNVVGEIARECGYRVKYLDDKRGDNVIGTIDLLPNYVLMFDSFFVAIGNTEFRKKLIDKLESLHVEIATIIHPTAYISPSAIVEKGTVVEPKAVINANSHIGKGCIISVGAIIDHNVSVGEFSHINAGAICKAGACIEAEQKIDSGEVVSGYN